MLKYDLCGLSENPQERDGTCPTDKGSGNISHIAKAVATALDLPSSQHKGPTFTQ